MGFPFSLSYLRAIAWAALAHGIFFSVFVLTVSGTPRDYNSEVSYHGGILRLQELLPVLKSDAVGQDAGVVFYPSHWGAVLLNGWMAGASVERNGPARSFFGEKAAPSKFATKRVELDADLSGKQNGDLSIPEAPRVLLKMPER